MTTIKELQIQQATEWLISYINADKENLCKKDYVVKNNIRPDTIYDAYKSSVNLPMSQKNLAPVLHSVGFRKIPHDLKQYYVLTPELSIV